MFLPLYSLVMDWVFPLKLSYRIESLRIWEHLMYVLHVLICRDNGIFTWSTWCMFWWSTCGFSVWHPGSEKPERPIFQPRDRGEVFWNTALLSIEQISSLLQSIGVQGDYIGTATLRLPLFLYASSRTNRGSGITSSSGTTATVVNSTPQGLWLELLS